MPQQQVTTDTTSPPLRVLRVDSSSRYEGSLTRKLTDELVEALHQRDGALSLTTRDLALGLPFIDENWVAANFTAEDARTTEQRSQLAYSDHLVRELQEADVIVIGAPIYNFSLPAALKAWIDMVARARLTFRYTENGPQGLLRDKKVYLVVASGGVAVDDPADFATPYLRHVLAFLGIDDLEIIAATPGAGSQDQALLQARNAIAGIAGVSFPVDTAQAA